MNQCVGYVLIKKISQSEPNYHWCHGSIATKLPKQLLPCLWAQLQHI
jgi:hypothetical protein